MQILFIGDITGNAGVSYVADVLPGLIQEHRPDLVVANGENAAANGRGLTKQAAERLYDSGVEILTLGNHVWDHKDAQELLANDARVVRPANMHVSAPGLGYTLCKVAGKTVAVVNVIGRTFMGLYDCPFRTMDLLLEELRSSTPFCVVDFHAEATSEKVAMGWHLAGRVSALIGTHTHIQTADERILPGGTAYLTDVGMTGPRDGILGVKRELILDRFIRQMPVRFELETGSRLLCAALITLDDRGKAVAVRRIQVSE